MKRPRLAGVVCRRHAFAAANYPRAARAEPRIQRVRLAVYCMGTTVATREQCAALRTPAAGRAGQVTAEVICCSYSLPLTAPDPPEDGG
jgi:hypothetical protein